MKNLSRSIACLMLLAAGNTLAHDHSADQKKSLESVASVTILSPVNGAHVTSPFTVKFGLTGKQVAPAGSTIANSGHHHLLIDSDYKPKAGLPMGAQVKHFGGGQTETSLTLAKGEHTLQLILGDAMHVPFDPPIVSKKITITVK